MKKEIVIRTAKPEDAEELLNIYAPYVLNTAITFEYDVPAIEEFTDRICRTLEQYPYLVAVIDDEIVGYAYAGRFKVRPAFDWAVEVSIYVKKQYGHNGIGKRLYEQLEAILKLQGITNLNAAIAYPETEDDYLDTNSVDFHKHMGYQFVGEFHKCGYKFGHWYNLVWMEKVINEHLPNQPKVRSFTDIERMICENYDLTK